MPSYVIRNTISKQTASNIIGKTIRISLFNSDNLYCNIGPVCDIYPIKNNRQKLVLIFYIENDIMKWVLYEYKQLEIPKNINTNIYNLIIAIPPINNGEVPIKITINSNKN